MAQNQNEQANKNTAAQTKKLKKKGAYNPSAMMSVMKKKPMKKPMMKKPGEY